MRVGRTQVRLEKKMGKKTKTNINVSVGPEYVDLMERISEAQQRDKTKIIRILLDRAAHELGLNPVGQLVDFGGILSPQ